MPGSPADVEILGPLREEEQELDGLLARARALAEQTVAAAEATARDLRAAAQAALQAEVRALGESRARRRAEEHEVHGAEAARRVGELRDQAAARREQALALIFARVMGTGP